MRIERLLVFLVALLGPGSLGLPRAAQAEGEPEAFRAWPAAARAAQERYEAVLADVPSPERLRAWHALFCRESHPAGGDGERRLIARMEEALRGLGLDTASEPFFALLPVHEDARVAVEIGDTLRPLPLRERTVAQDPAVAQDVPPAFNAYSGSGEARGEVVYANYGTLEDFAQLAALGVPVRGRIVVARYGRNFRGYKVKFAEEAGAAGVLLYTDPDDSGYRKGLPYPEGGWANETSIQRGSINTLDHPGDPLTPFEPATEDAARLDPEAVALPRIPVQPIGWEAAGTILGSMKGPRVPDDWQGGLPHAYRLTGGPDLKVRLMVRQPRRVLPSANVIARLPGTRHPEQVVVVGCHFDAWTFGAGDPHAGSIVLFEMARSFAEAARAGLRPARTIVFASWGAEEYGIIGSTEWCEAHREALADGCVAYVNLDMAAMGPQVHASAAPLLKRLLLEAAQVVPQAREEDARSVFEAWSERGGGTAPVGNLGGGSDHVGFTCHLGIPALSLGAGGSDGVAYHTAYDTLAWYRRVVGDDYAPARMLARLGNVFVARLANAPLLPLDPTRYAPDLRTHLAALAERASARGTPFEPTALLGRVEALEVKATGALGALEAAVADGTLTGEPLARANAILLGMDRAWLVPEGLPGRPWYRSAYAASDPTSGYAAWMLPLLRAAIEDPTVLAPAAATATTAAILARLERDLDALGALAPPTASR